VRVIAVVVHWRDIAETRGCLEALAAAGVEALVVDNGSPEPIGPGFAAAALTVRSTVNVGYAGGANLGIRAARERGADVVLLLNNDARLHLEANGAACDVLAADGRVAVVGAKVLTREDPSRLWLAWGEVNYRQSLVALHGAGRPAGPPFDRDRDVPWVAGCAMWLRVRALDAVGLFDERFFAYHEEVDWCVRAWRGGWRVVYCPRVVVTHTGRGSHGSPESIRVRQYVAARNAILYARKHGSRLERAKLAFFLAASLPLELLRHLPVGRAGEVLLKMRGVRDALAGRRPPLETLGLR
jgi:GT2 family glycosyltransferase